ncbi:coiled-coil domain-containing protein 63-like isoform X2 [Ranitomeya variabilis]|uniref:coiled-coil domain-containing protein 63-like isoform X2 n=1 Tax=Ranitomeya variabilis TaxID=490064 RepID=UPI004056027F
MQLTYSDSISPRSLKHSKMQIEKKLDWHLPSLGKNEYAEPTEMDLKKLEHQYRVAEIMKASFRKQTEHLLLSQQTDINVLKEQQKAMELTKLCRGSQKFILKDQENAKKLCELAEAQDQYNRLVEEQKKLISDLNMKIKEKEEEVVEQKNAMSQAKTSQGRIAQLENELQHVTQNFNVIKTENEKLKENINHLRFKKTKYLNLIDKMHQKIIHQKALTEKMQERITSMHNEKSDIQTEVLTVKDVAEKEFKKYDIKIEELNRYLDHLNKQQQFNETKLFDRFTKERELQKKRQEKRLEEMKKHNQGIIDNYNSICERLRHIYGQQDVDLDKMAKQYMLNNMKIYSLFTYVNKVNNEVEEIIQDIKSSEDEILHLESCNKNLLNEQLVRQKELEEKLQNISETTDKYNFKCREMSRELLLITSAAEDLVKNLGFDTSSMKKKLGFENSTCQEKLQYFKILETEMDKLIQILSYCALGDAAQGSLSSATISATLVASNVSCIVGLKKISLPSMPKTIKPTDDTVLGFNELREKVLNHAIFREKRSKTKRQTHSLKYMTSGNIKRRSNK